MIFVWILILLVFDKKLIWVNLFSGKNYFIFCENFVWVEIYVWVLCKWDSLVWYGGDLVIILKLFFEMMFIVYIYVIMCLCVNFLVWIFFILFILGCYLVFCNICIGLRLVEEFCMIVGLNILERLLVFILYLCSVIFWKWGYDLILESLI